MEKVKDLPNCWTVATFATLPVILTHTHTFTIMPGGKSGWVTHLCLYTAFIGWCGVLYLPLGVFASFDLDYFRWLKNTVFFFFCFCTVFIKANTKQCQSNQELQTRRRIEEESFFCLSFFGRGEGRFVGHKARQSVDNISSYEYDFVAKCWLEELPVACTGCVRRSISMLKTLLDISHPDG